jgi:hypothetical protein
MISFFSPCFAKWIGVLHVKIGLPVEKLFKRGVFEKNCSLAPLEWNVLNFDDLNLFRLFC